MDTPRVPRHVAIIMDGNGRWARRRHLPRTAGHKVGVRSVRAVVEESIRQGVEVLTLFAFSSENWRRPPSEVKMLMDLFLGALRSEVRRLHDNGVRLQVLGDRRAFPPRLQESIREAEDKTRANQRLRLQVAANYGGRWDILQAARRLAEEAVAGRLDPAALDEATFAGYLATADSPDLFIRTGGEQRLSNFLLWQSAYSELYFSEHMWPDFNAAAYVEALAEFGRRQRRFGLTGEQLDPAPSAATP